MPDAIIENPILNSPFEEPTRHFKFTDDGITNEVVEVRRLSGYFVPIPQPKKKGKQLVFDSEWTQDRFKESEFINRIRDRVNVWRQQGWPGITNTTTRLLQHWSDPERERKLFFCQVEALETAIYLTEVADKGGDAWIANSLREANESANPGLYRIAFKMATGSGKTVVMGMLIAWQTLNKLQNPQDARFSDSFLLVAPGITIRDRLRVLLPNDPGNYYRAHDLVPTDLFDRLGQARIVIANFHGFLLREKGDASKTTKAILTRGRPGVFTESPDEMVRRVCRELGTKKNIVVLNDEAHHCYRRRPEGEDEKLAGEERKEAKKREEEARVWISGLEAIQKKLGIRATYDLSATPFFLKGSGYSEGTLFPWVVSDFSLIDAIESGIVKVPRVPVADDSMIGDKPTYRDLWRRIRDALPKKGRGTEDAGGSSPHLPKELQGALHSLYNHYEKAYRQWEGNTEARANGLTSPVFIVVCNNTNVSKLVFDYVAGWEKPREDGSKIVVPGAFGIFSNEENGQWRARPNTILVDSEQLESGEAMAPEFKKIVAAEIEEWKAEYRARFPGRDAEDLTDEDLLREVMNTVGKQGKLGEGVRCVVSVSMLTEGWDANTVTHILGVRKFGTQLLCEQVIGRGLRRMSYAVNEGGMFSPEYAEVYGVPFSFIPCSGSTPSPKPGVIPTRVRALEERLDREITFPRLEGYRFETGDEPLKATFSEESRYTLSTEQVPTTTENAPIVGEISIHTLEDLKARRPQEVEFLLAKLVCEKYFRDKPWRFPEVLAITRRWLKECLVLKDKVFPQYLLFQELALDVADRIYRSIASSVPGAPRLRPILLPYDSVGSTRYVDFDTTRSVWATRAEKSHVSHVVLDSNWEAKLAESLEDMSEVTAYVKNFGLGFTIPYTLNDQVRQYNPDYLVRIANGQGGGTFLTLILEVTGEKKKDKEAKVDTARRLWIPAINNDGRFGRWAFLEIKDPWRAQTEIRSLLTALREGRAA
jgi:type III restriction enzyme